MADLINEGFEPLEGDAERQQDHPERTLWISTIFLWNMRHLSPATVQHILVEALDATYKFEAGHFGSFAVYTSGDRTLSMSIWLEVEMCGRCSRGVLNARWDWHRSRS